MNDEFAGWHRAGRGREFQFYATDDEIAAWLSEMLLPSFGPYCILGFEWQGEEWRSFEYEFDRLDAAFAEHREANLWLRSKVLTPELNAGNLAEPADVRRVSFGGLILLQLGQERDGRREQSRLAIVDRIRHESTGEELRASEYLQIFERLRRSMRKRLVVTTAFTDPDGATWDHFPMTPRAAEAHARGEVVFDAEPVGLRP